jgi:hypothetical protein
VLFAVPPELTEQIREPYTLHYRASVGTDVPLTSRLRFIEYLSKKRVARWLGASILWV